MCNQELNEVNEQLARANSIRQELTQLIVECEYEDATILNLFIKILFNNDADIMDAAIRALYTSDCNNDLDYLKKELSHLAKLADDKLADVCNVLRRLF